MSELQRTEQWHLDRAGKWTGSKFHDIIAKNKKTGAPLKSRSDAIWSVVVERITGQPNIKSAGEAMKWGIDVEPFAREAYELDTGTIVADAGFIVHPLYQCAGVSPDGLIGEDGGIEIKCPRDSEVHLQRFVEGMPEEYYAQVQGAMWVTGRSWWDFVSFDPRMPESHRLYCQRIGRDNYFIKQLEQEILAAEHEAKALLQHITKEAA